MSEPSLEFPFRPSGADWQRLMQVVARNEAMKADPGDVEEQLRDVIDVYTVAFAALQRASEVCGNDASRVAQFSASWTEGCLFGVLFEQYGGTAGEHDPLAAKTESVRAMLPARDTQLLVVNENLFTRPDSPDWDRMEQVMDVLHERFDRDLTTEPIMNELFDVYAVVYLAVNRVRATFPAVGEDEVAALAGAWVEGFLYGVLFQQLGGTVTA